MPGWCLYEMSEGGSSVQIFFIKTNRVLQEPKSLELMWTQKC